MMKKRFWALFLAVMMVVSVMPTTAFAEEGVSLFSIFEAPVGTYEFQDAKGERIVGATQILRIGESLSIPPAEESDGAIFQGWFIDEVEVTADYVQPTISEDTTYIVTPEFKDVTYVTFTDGDIVYDVREIVSGEVDVGNVSYIPASNKTLLGWSENAGSAAADFTGSNLANRNYEVYPITTTSPVVTFDHQDEAGTIHMESVENSQINEPSNPERIGYKFLFWTEDIDAETPVEYDFDTIVTADKTLYAVWDAEIVEYTVVYWKENADNDEYTFTELITRTAEAGTMVTATEADQSKYEDDFFSYNAEATGEIAVNGDGSTILNVFYARNQFTLTFKADDVSTVCGKQEHNHIEDRCRYHYEYERICDGDHRYHRPSCWKSILVWDCNKTEHTHDDSCYPQDGDASVFTITAKHGAAIADEFDFGSYTGLAWEEPGQNDYYGYPLQTLDRMPTSDITFELYYDWDKVKEQGRTQKTMIYWVEVLHGETAEKIEDGIGYKELKSVDTYFNYPTYNEEYHPIAGYIRTMNRDIFGSSRYWPDSTWEFYYSREKYPLTYYNYNAKAKTEYVPFEEALDEYYEYEPDSPSGMNGYTFEGWYLSPACEEGTEAEDHLLTMPLDGAIVYAKWSAPTHDVKAYYTIDINGTKEVLEIEHGAMLSIADLPSVSGMSAKLNYSEADFLGWYDADGNAFLSGTVTDEMELFARWRNEAYSVTYDNGNGRDLVSDKLLYVAGSSAVVLGSDGLTAPEGQKFECWTDDDDNTYYPGSLVVVPVGGIKLTAVYADLLSINMTSVTYVANNDLDEVDKTEKVELNNGTFEVAENSFTAPKQKAFDGWNTEADGTGDTYLPGDEAHANDPEEENILYAQWADDINEDKIPDKYQVFVYFKANGNGDVGKAGEEIFQVFTAKKDKDGKYEETVTFTPATVTPIPNTGYAFDFWYKDEVSTEKVDPFTQHVNLKTGISITYTATFDKNTFNVTYAWTGLPSEGMQPLLPAAETHQYQEQVTVDTYWLEGAQTTVGEDTYVFSGWDTKDFTMPAKDVKITGFWELDNWNDEDDKLTGGDKIPDKYQAEVTYKVENGTWSDNNTKDIVELFTLYEKNESTGQWNLKNPAVTLDDTVPTGMLPNDGYLPFGAWDAPVPYAGTIVVDGSVYVYKFQAANTLIFNFDANGGKWESDIPGYTMNADKTVASVKVAQGSTVSEITPIPTAPACDKEGYEYVFTGWYALPADEDVKIRPWNFENLIYENDRTVYARWAERRLPVVYDEPDTLYIYCQDENGAQVGADDIGYQRIPMTLGEDYTVTPVQTIQVGNDKYIYEGINEYSPVQELIVEHSGGKGKTFVLILNYTLDNLDDKNDEPTGGDNIPDKYQAVVTYKVIHGTWDGTKADPIDKIFTLKEKDTNGVWKDIEGVVLGDTVPSGMKADAAYLQSSGEWDADIKAETPVTGYATYTYEFKITKSPSVSIEKKVDKTSVPAGDNITYTIIVKNTGTVDLTGLTVVDDFTKGGDQDRTWVIDKLIPGESKTIKFTYRAITTDVDGLTNKATVSGSGVYGETPEVKTDVYREKDVVRPSKPALNKEDHYAYVVGYPDGLVHPERNITRAEVATIFFRMLLDESREDFWSQENWFSDVKSTDWFNNAVSTLANANLINGYPDGSYKPNANITRAEFATIAIRFFLEDDVEITENNLSDIKGHWAEANINLAYALNLINGYPDGTFRPDQKITRAEAMTIVNRVLERAPHKDHLLDDMIEWPDNMDTDVWYYADVQEATNSHEFYKTKDKDEDEKYEVWTELLPIRDWVALEQMWSQANSSKNPGEVVDININTPEAGNNGTLKLN